MQKVNFIFGYSGTMKILVCAISLTLLSGLINECHAQFKVTYSFSNNDYSMVQTYAEETRWTAVTIGSTGLSTGTNLTFFTSSVPTTYTVDSRDYEWEQAGAGQPKHIISNCTKSKSISLGIPACGGVPDYSFSGSTQCGTTYSLSVHIEPVYGLSIPPTNQVLCVSDQYAITANSGFSSYLWEYNVSSSGWNTLSTTGNVQQINPATVFGANYLNYLNKTIVYRLTVSGSCSNTMGPFTFSSKAPTLSDGNVDKIAAKCSGGKASLKVNSMSRGFSSNEKVTITLYKGTDTSNPANLGPQIQTASFPIQFDNLDSDRDYYALVESKINIDGSGGESATPCAQSPVPLYQFRINSPPQFTISATATLYNGSTITCVGARDGQITVTPSNGTSPYQYSKDNGSSYGTSNIFSSLDPGSYTIKARDANNCDAVITSTNPISISNPTAVSFDSPVVSSDYHGFDISCHGISDATIRVDNATGGSGGLAAKRYSVDNINYQVGNTLTGIGTGSYRVYVKDANNCMTQSQNLVPVGDVPALVGGTLNKTNPSCFNYPDGAITVSGTSGGTGAGTYTYSIKDASNNAAVMNALRGLPAGSAYTVYVKDANACTVAIPTTLFGPENIVVDASTEPATCFGKSDGKIMASVLSGGVGSFQYTVDPSLSVSSFQTETTISDLAKGFYTLTAKDSKGCFGQKTMVEVGQQPTLTGTINETVSILCHGDTGLRGAALDLTPIGGPSAGVYSYEWSSSTATNFSNTQDVSQLPAGLYSVKISKHICSTTLPNIIIAEPDELVASLSKTDVSCNVSHGPVLSSNGIVDLTPTGGTLPYTIDWSNGEHTEDISNLISGDYSVTLTDANGCETTSSTTLIEPTTVTSAIALYSDVTCKDFDNGVIKIAAAGGSSIYNYSLNGGAAQPSEIFPSLSPGDYTILVADSKGCTSQISQSIVEPDKLLISTGDIINATCGNRNGSATSTVTGGTLPYSYRWQDVSNQLISTGTDLSSVTGGVYNVTVTDQRNCTSTAFALISSADGPQIQRNSITPTTCFDTPDGKADVTISAGTAPYRVSWNNGEVGTSPVALFPGNNIITVNDERNCVAVELVKVPHPDPVAIDTKVITPPTCPGTSDAVIALTSKGGSGGYTYDWGNGNTSAGIENVPAGEYAVTIKDSRLCTLVTSIIVDPIPDLKLSVVSAQLPNCFGYTDGALTVIATGGNGTYSYQWTNNTTGPLLNNIPAGNYAVKATDINGCVGTSEFILDNPVKFVFSIEDKMICVGQKYNLKSEVANGTYLWSSANGFSSTEREVTLTEPGTYQLQVTDAKGCFAEDGFELKTSTDLLHADILMVTEAFQRDTVVVIDLSWPLPDASTWIFPSGAAVIEDNAQLGYAFIQFDNAGEYDVALQVALGGCVDKDNQMITILGEERPGPSGGRQNTSDLIKYVEVSPNPNKGEFEIETELSEIASARMLIINMEGNKVLVNVTDEGKSSYKWQVSIPEVNQGTYFIVLKAGDETKAIRMLKL